MANNDMDVFEQAVINLLNSKQGLFYASLILMMKRNPCKMERGAMGVGFKGGQVNIYYDPEWLNKMTVQQVMFCLEHECIHLILDHLERMGDRDPKLWNFAADLVVNGYILEDPGVCQKPYEIIEPGGRGIFADMPKGKTSEWYFEQIREKMDHYEMKDNGDGTCTVTNKRTGESENFKLSDHGEWDSMKQGDESLNKEIVKAMVKEAYSEAKSRGMQPGGGMSQLIDDFLNKSMVNWKAMLRRQVAASILSRDRKSSWKRVSRRYGETRPGAVRVRQPKIVAAFDTSGSMSDAELAEAASELMAIKKIYNATIEVIECDAEIHRTYDLSKYKPIKRDFTGRGGTAFTPVFEYLKNKELDVLIYFTDLYGDDPEKPRHFKSIWVSPSAQGDNGPKPPFGTHIQIPAEKKPRG